MFINTEEYCQMLEKILSELSCDRFPLMRYNIPVFTVMINENSIPNGLIKIFREKSRTVIMINLGKE